MFTKQWSYLQFGKRFCGIEHTTKTGQPLIVASLLKKAKSQLTIEQSFEALSIEDAVEKLPKKQHAVLIINNSNVLSKTIESEQNDNLKLVYKAFPNINLGDFYFEVLHQNNTHFIALCRKQYIDDLIDTYSQKGISILNFSLGNASISNILDFITTPSVSTSNAIISIDTNSIQRIENTETTVLTKYDINGLKVSNQEVLSFSAALQTVLENNNQETNFEEEKLALTNTYKQSHFFNQFLKFGGVFILGLLLINFFVFNHYFNNVNELRQLSEVNQDSKNVLLKLNEVVSKKQKMVDDLLKSNASKSSFYLNSIIQELPNTILLSDLNYQPLTKRIKKEQPIQVLEHSINISGTSTNSAVFSKWVTHLEQLDWVVNVVIVEYGSALKSSSGFSLKITIAND